MPIPLIIGAAGIVTNLIGAKKGATAAKSAATQQQASVDKAQAFNQQAWEAQQRALSPYQQAGQYSLAALMARQYGGSAQSYLPPQSYGPPQGGRGNVQTPMGLRPGSGGPMSLAAMQNRGTQRMNAGMVGMQNTPQGGFQPPPPQFPTLDGHTLMLSPDGDPAHVPHGNVDEAMRRGALPYEGS